MPMSDTRSVLCMMITWRETALADWLAWAPARSGRWRPWKSCLSPLSAAAAAAAAEVTAEGVRTKDEDVANRLWDKWTESMKLQVVDFRLIRRSRSPTRGTEHSASGAMHTQCSIDRQTAETLRVDHQPYSRWPYIAIRMIRLCTAVHLDRRI